jgi:signal transduction histidine kinase
MLHFLIQYSSKIENWQIKWIGMAVAFGLWLLLIAVRTLWMPDRVTVVEALASLVAILGGAVIFWSWIVRKLEQRDAEIHRQIQRLEALHSAALTLSVELDVGVVLQKVVDLSRELVNARYGALGVLAEDGHSLEQFITSGFSPEQRAAIGVHPRGDGLLGLSIREEQPIRISNIQQDARAANFPPNHPVMNSLLSVPVISKNTIIGTLFLTDKLQHNERCEERLVPFSEENQKILVMFATQAAIAIENARLYRQNERLAVLQERERFARDLHDGIIQSIYGVGLILEDGQHLLDRAPELTSDRIDQSIDALNTVIVDIRNYILELRPQHFHDYDLQQGLEELVREVRDSSFLNVTLEMESLEPDFFSAEETFEILYIVQEALNNVRRHALATQVNVVLQQCEGQLVLTVTDNGIGFDPETVSVANGRGIQNMQERASDVHGHLSIKTPASGGTQVWLSISFD